MNKKIISENIKNMFAGKYKFVFSQADQNCSSKLKSHFSRLNCTVNACSYVKI